MEDSFNGSDNEEIPGKHLTKGMGKEGRINEEDEVDQSQTMDYGGNIVATGSKYRQETVNELPSTTVPTFASSDPQNGHRQEAKNAKDKPTDTPVAATEEIAKISRPLMVVIAVGILCVLVHQFQEFKRFNDRTTELEKFKQTHAEEMIVANVKIEGLFSLLHQQKREINKLQEDLMMSNSKVELIESKITELERLFTSPKKSDSGGEWLWNSLDNSPTPSSSQEYKTKPYRSQSENTAINTGKAVTVFRNSLNSLMESEFRSQSSDTRVQLLSSVASTMTEVDPTRPSAVLFLSPPSLDPSFGLCFAKKVATIVNNAFENGNKDGDPKVLDPDYFRKMTVLSIHEDLKNYLDSGLKAVVVSNLAEIQEEPLLMTLHAFCENSHSLAYDSRANFFSVLTVPEEVYKANEWTHWQGKYIAKESLDIIWKTALDDDKRGALISRVASSVVLLQPGDTCRYG